ncbi:MAG: hypothetical protein AAFY56_10970 [Pseudomonadota bacterium]
MKPGAVLGVDVGFSKTRASTAICLLSWSEDEIRWSIRHFRALEPERTNSIAALCGELPILAAAFDGPLATGLGIIGQYRLAEKMLTRRLGKTIGKPGQSNSPVGKLLNAAANDLARIVVDVCNLDPATFPHAIHEKAIVETFPTAFMGLMIDRPDALSARRSDRSDLYFCHLIETKGIEAMLTALLPGRRSRQDLGGIADHDDRAAFVAAIAALCVTAGNHVAVGDPNGWIALPPRRFIRPGPFAHLEANAGELGQHSLRIYSPRQN